MNHYSLYELEETVITLPDRFVYTNTPVAKSLHLSDSYIWLIKGSGEPKNYRLVKRLRVTNVVETNERFEIEGEPTKIEKELSKNEIWFQNFLKTQFFRRGLAKISDATVINEFEKMVL